MQLTSYKVTTTQCKPEERKETKACEEENQTGSQNGVTREQVDRDKRKRSKEEHGKGRYEH